MALAGYSPPATVRATSEWEAFLLQWFPEGDYKAARGRSFAPHSLPHPARRPARWRCSAPRSLLAAARATLSGAAPGVLTSDVQRDERAALQSGPSARSRLETLMSCSWWTSRSLPMPSRTSVTCYWNFAGHWAWLRTPPGPRRVSTGCPGETPAMRRRVAALRRTVRRSNQRLRSRLASRLNRTTGWDNGGPAFACALDACLQSPAMLNPKHDGAARVTKHRDPGQAETTEQAALCPRNGVKKPKHGKS